MKEREDYWKNKSLLKTREKLEIARNSAAFFNRNKNFMEERVGSEAEMYRKSLYGLFQINKQFNPKYKSSMFE